MLNLFKLFRDLIPKQPTTVGTLVSGAFPYYDADLVGGGVQKVFAATDDFAIAEKVYIQDGKITGRAFSLTDYVVDI